MEIKYEKIFFTKISEYQVKIEVTNSGKNLVKVQRFTADKESSNPCDDLNVHPDILLDLIGALEECRDLLEIKPREEEKKIPINQQLEIRKRYLRGVSIKDLCIQFDRDQYMIEKVIMDGDIEIIDPKMSIPYKPSKAYRDKRFSKYYKRK